MRRDLFVAISRVVIAIALQFEAEQAASREDVDAVPVRKQASALRADTPIDHVAGDLGSAFDPARAHHGAVGEPELVMELEELSSRVGIQGDHGSLAVLIADEHDAIADGERAKGLSRAHRALDAVVRGPLPQDLS